MISVGDLPRRRPVQRGIFLDPVRRNQLRALRSCARRSHESPVASSRHCHASAMWMKPNRDTLESEHFVDGGVAGRQQSFLRLKAFWFS
jgi:hypothetical protein